jgi:DNA-binding Lrp family transcriptional regulator
MADAGHNSMDKRIRDVRELQQAELMLLKGTTINALAEAIGCSKEQARRLVRALKALGCEITDNFVLGMREAAAYKMTASTRCFAKKAKR